MAATSPTGFRRADGAVADPASTVLPVQLIGADGLIASAGGGGGGGGGDASAANQVTGNNTLASILAKLIANPATDALQTAGNATLTTIAGKDFATQTTLAAVLAKLTNDPATQTTLAAVLAKLTSDPSTATLQTAGNSSLSTIAGKDFATQTTLALMKTALDTVNTSTASALTKLDTVHTDIGLTNTALAHRKSGTIWDGATDLVVKNATINAAASGNNTLITAVASKKLRIVAVSLQSAGVVTATFQSGAGGTPITGPYTEAASTGIVLPFNPHGWFETLATNTLLNLSLSAAIQVGGTIQYVEF